MNKLRKNPKKITWFTFQKNNQKRKAVKKAKFINGLLKHGSMDLALKDTEISGRALRKYLLEGDFRDKLIQIAPFLSANALGTVIEAMKGEATDTQLKAAKEILKGFLPKALGNHEITFDSNVRRQVLANEGLETAVKIQSAAEVAKVLAKDPFTDWSAKIEQEKKAIAVEYVPPEPEPIDEDPNYTSNLIDEHLADENLTFEDD